MKFDVIRAVEAAYAGARDHDGWLSGLLETLGPLDDDVRMFARVVTIGVDGRVAFESEARLGAIRESELEENQRFQNTLPAEANQALHAPSPPVDYALRRAARCSSTLAAQVRSYLQSTGVEDVLGILATEPSGTVLLIAKLIAPGHPRLSARTLHQLTRFSAHLNSGLRLRHALPGVRTTPADDALTEAVLDPAGRVLDAMKGAQAKDARQGLADAVRRIDRARGPLRRTDPDNALQLWQGLVDGTWSLVDQCDSDGKRYILARRNEPGARDPRALSQRERSVVAFASMGHQNKFIGYLLGLSAGTVAGHLQSAQRKLGLASRAELIRLAFLLQAAPDTVPEHP